MLSSLAWAKVLESNREIFCSGPCFGPHVTACVCSMEIPGGWFSLCHLGCLLYLTVCAGVTSGTWHPRHLCLVSCPTLSPLWSWPDEFLCVWDFPKMRLQLCSGCLFFVLHSVTVELYYFAFLVWCLVSLWSGFNVTSVWILWDVACSFLKTILGMFVVRRGILNQ